MKIFITGIRGFLGSQLADELRERGHRVAGSSTNPERPPRLRMGDAVDPAVFEDADTVVHAAHDFTPGSVDRNVAGSLALFEAARGRRQIFISSHSARPDAIGEYGISKYRIERAYLTAGETIVRPGLVIGPGGVFARTLRTLRTSRVVPLVDGGRDAVPILAIADFRDAMTGLIESGAPGAYNLFDEQMPAMREVVETVLRLDSRKALLVPVPFMAALVAIRTLELLHVPAPFKADGLRAVRLNRVCVHQSNLRELLPGVTSLEAAIRSCVT
jgi:nucleoside-diphosphate-sugar epimerase